jgi:heme oxygenase
VQETLLQALRRATAPRHARIEELLQLDAPFTLSHYARVLRGFDHFFAEWEPRIARALPGRGAWLASRSRRPLLDKDLSALRVQRAAAGSMPAIRLANESAAYGSLYVVEGSALGGQVVAKRAAAQHGLDPSHGAAYFGGWGGRTSAMWREFVADLDRHDASGADHDAACVAAQQTFDALMHHCSRSLHGH